MAAPRARAHGTTSSRRRAFGGGSGVFWLAAILVNMTGSASAIFDPATLRLFFFETPFAPLRFCV